jgi:hypothetical protein
VVKTKKAATAKAETETRKNGRTKHTKPAAEAENLVTIDRRTSKERRKPERRRTEAPVVEERRKLERRTKVPRRRQIDPTTCERDYRDEEVEFMNALDQYKRTSGRMFPTCSEVLEVLRSLGYEKRPMVEPAAGPVVTELLPVLSEVPAMATIAG